MITTGRRQLNRRTGQILAVLVLGVLAMSAAGPAAAAEACAKRVIDDWNADGRVDGTYDLPCYDDAIEELPRDVRDYSSAVEDIERAMQRRLRGETAPPATTDPDGDTGTGGSGGGPGDPDDSTEAGPGGFDPGDVDGDDDVEAVPPVDTTSSDSIPLPLLVLAALALLLVAAGSIGYLVRRSQSRRVPPASL